MKKPHQVKVVWRNSSKRTTTRSFVTKGEADAFISGISICFQELGDGDYDCFYTDKTKK